MTKASATAGKPATKTAVKKPVASASGQKKMEPPAVPKSKAKLVRDSFTIPKNEYLVLGALKDRASHLRRPIKKSELLRAGIAALSTMNDRAFLEALAKVSSLKTGRPKDATPAPSH